ncbi:hypothetical protein [Methylomonas sp. AM2-LC]|uniref:hypothetical protein n=1 Tax=Methylomonas sp. AM2-LC TaxID=3153301 RepID=UPI00326513AA
MQKPNPSFPEILGEFDAGIFQDKVQEALKMVALGTINHGKKGSLVIQIDLEQIGNSSSVTVKHTVKYAQPTRNGKSSEEATTSTPMYVNNLGYLTINQQTDADLFETNGNITTIRSIK